MKRCSTSLFIREMQIKTTMSCHVTPTMIATIKKQKTNVGEKLECLCTVGGNAKWYSYRDKQYGGSSPKIKI